MRRPEGQSSQGSWIAWDLRAMVRAQAVAGSEVRSLWGVSSSVIDQSAFNLEWQIYIMQIAATSPEPLADNTNCSQPSFPVSLIWPWNLGHPAFQEVHQPLQRKCWIPITSPPCLHQTCTDKAGRKMLGLAPVPEISVEGWGRSHQKSNQRTSLISTVETRIG